MGKIVALMSNPEPTSPSPERSETPLRLAKDSVEHSEVPLRFAKGTVGATMILLLLGGIVTTIGAGMAVMGWLDAEGHFMPLFPFDKWFRDFATFSEHTHRMVGLVVGLLLIALVVATYLKDSRKLARRMTLIALIVVIGQGTLGGFRVLENSQHLAFLHGAIAQAVFATIWCTALVLLASFRRGGTVAPEAASRLRKVGLFATLVIFGQVVLGAWFRHSIRHATTVESSGATQFPMGAFIAHAMGAILVAGAALMLAKTVRTTWEQTEDETIRKVLRRQEVWLHMCFGIQFMLGLGALGMLGLERDAIPVVVLTTLHLLFGALLLSAAAAGCFWGVRLQTPGIRLSTDQPSLSLLKKTAP